jgi:tape measure domain-containing protein
MADKHSVEAVLSATDKGFTSGFQRALGTLNTFAGRVKTGIGFGALMAIGQKAIGAISSGISGLVGEMNDSSAAWKTFKGNMKSFGKSEDYIKDVRKELQDFAQKTIYSASDMATTFSQLEAVGTKNTKALVKGFGGLAATAAEPAQAMKSLSMQATQMAAKPKVAWQDFKIMMEQAPAGVAAVAKEMGMSTAELVAAVQDGKVKTQAFFDAVEKAGNSDALQKMATEYKTIGQAMDGLTETAANKLAPVFGVIESAGIKAVSAIADWLDKVDFESVAAGVQKLLDKLKAFFEKLKPYWEAFKDAAQRIGSAFQKAFQAVGDKLKKLNGGFGSTKSVDGFKSVVDTIADVLVKVAGFIEKNADAIAKFIQFLPKLVAGFMALSFIGKIAPGISGIASKLTSLGGASAASSGNILQSAVAILAMGGAVLLAAAGFWVLTQAATQLANAGTGAILVLVGMVAVIALLAVGAAAIGPKLTAGAVGLVAFGAALLMVGAGMFLVAQASVTLASGGWAAIGCLIALTAIMVVMAVIAAALGPALAIGAAGFLLLGIALVLVSTAAILGAVALQMIAAVLPQVIQYGAQGAGAIALLGAAMIVFGIGATIVSVALLIAAAAVLVLAVAVAVLAAGMLIMGVAAILCAAALVIISTVLPQLAAHGEGAATAIIALGTSLLALGAGALVAGAGMLVLGAGLLVVAAALLAAGVAALMLGTGMMMIGTGAMIAAVALALISVVLPAIATSGGQASVALIALGAALVVLGAGALVASVGVAAFGAALLITGAALLLAGAGAVLLGAGIILIATGALLAAVALTLMAVVLPAVAADSLQAAPALVGLSVALVALGAAGIASAAGVALVSVTILALGAALLVTMAGSIGTALGLLGIVAALVVLMAMCGSTAALLKALSAALKKIGSAAKSSMQDMISAFTRAATQSKAAALLIGKSFTVALASALDQATTKTQASMTKLLLSMVLLVPKAKQVGLQVGNNFKLALVAALMQALNSAQSVTRQIPPVLASATGGAYASGRNIGLGLAGGMQSTLGAVRSVASQLASAADAAIRAKARIASPSRVQIENGEWWGVGFAKGIERSTREVQTQSQALLDVAVPQRYASSYSQTKLTTTESAPQPLELTLNLGGRLYRAFVSDINKINSEEIQLREVFSV